MTSHDCLCYDGSIKCYEVIECTAWLSKNNINTYDYLILKRESLRKIWKFQEYLVKKTKVTGSSMKVDMYVEKWFVIFILH